MSSKAIDAMKQRVRAITWKKRGRSVGQMVAELRGYLKGWWGYYGHTEVPVWLQGVMGWMRRRVRCYILYQYKHPKRAYKALRALGASDRVARKVAKGVRHWWRNSAGNANRALPNSYLAKLGLPNLLS